MYMDTAALRRVAEEDQSQKGGAPRFFFLLFGGTLTVLPPRLVSPARYGSRTS